MRARAFTLIEMVVVIVLIGIVTAVGAFSYTTFFSGTQDQYGPQVTSSVILGLRNTATANNFTIPAGRIASTPGYTISGIPVTTGPSTAPSDASAPSDFTVHINFPQDPVAAPAATAAGIAVETTPGQCYGAVFRTAVTGDQRSYFTSEWETSAGAGCDVSRPCLNGLLDLPTTESSYKGLDLSDNNCALSLTP